MSPASSIRPARSGRSRSNRRPTNRVRARCAATLDGLYPPDDARFLRIHAADGWAVVLDTAMRGHKQFGSLRVGTIVDCLAPFPGAPAVIRAAARALEDRGVDLIVSNQLHAAWSRALLDAAFRRGPSNFLLALSPALAADAPALADGELHINRGDGDGPTLRSPICRRSTS